MQTVEALTKQLEDGLRAKNRLMVAQKLMVVRTLSMLQTLPATLT
jgi:hypothetical protein